MDSIRASEAPDSGSIPDEATKYFFGLRKREAMFVGLAALIPSKIQLNYLEEDERPKSNDISFIKGWQNGYSF